MTTETQITDGKTNLRGNLTVREKPKKTNYTLYLPPTGPFASVETKDNRHPVSHGLQAIIDDLLKKVVSLTLE